MNYKTENSYTEEVHLWKEYIPQNADKIVLGTFPPRKDRWWYYFFYPNKNNKFWTILSTLAGIPLPEVTRTEQSAKEAVIVRKQILDKLNLAISDMGAKVLRQNNSSLDSNLFPLQFTDIFKLLSDYPKIRKIIFTSSTKGHSALGWFITYCNINGINPVFDKDNPKKATLTLEGKEIEIIAGHSPSPITGKSINFLVEHYREIFFG